MDPMVVVEIGQQSLVLVMLISGPLLLAGLVVGLMVGVFQAVTQIHEMTLTFIPKILAIVGVLLAMLPWMIMKMVDFTIALFNRIPTLVN
jgi:flagellar biosynthetic protein FliQ